MNIEKYELQEERVGKYLEKVKKKGDPATLPTSELLKTVIVVSWLGGWRYTKYSIKELSSVIFTPSNWINKNDRKR